MAATDLTPRPPRCRFSSDMPEADRALLTVELERLTAMGADWEDAYAQCVLQTAADAVQYE